MALRLGLLSLIVVFLFKSSSAESELICPEENGFFADAIDCCIFYRCVAGRPYEFFCPSGTFFDPIDKICNWPREVEDCDAQGRRVYYENGNVPDYGENTFGQNPNAEPGPSNIPNSEPEYPLYPDTDFHPDAVDKDAFVCPESEGFFAHPRDCKRFFRCVAQKPIPFNCAHGTFFDQTISVCNFPEKVSECDSNGNRVFGVAGDYPDYFGPMENANNPASSDSEMHATGFIPCSDQYSLHPHPKSCTKFIYCHKYDGLLFECPRGLNFDRQRLICDFPQNAPC